MQVGYRGDNGCCKRYSTVRQALRMFLFLVEFLSATLAPLSFSFNTVSHSIQFDANSVRRVVLFHLNFIFHRSLRAYGTVHNIMYV